MKPPPITVIVPWRNAPIEALRRALLSVQRQSTHARVETVVIDDASEHAASLAAERLVAKLNATNRPIRLLKLDKHGGISNARNAGLASTKAPFVTWLDADDHMHKLALQLLCEAQGMTSSPLVLGDTIVLENGARIKREVAPFLGRLHEEMAGTADDPWCLSVFAIQPQLVSTAVALEAGGFSPDFHWAEMTEFFLRAAHHVGSRQIAHAPKSIYYYNRNGGPSHSSERACLDRFRRKSLVEHAQRCGIALNDLNYAGREAATGAQFYLRSEGGEPIWPQYLRPSHDSVGENPVVYLDSRYVAQPW